jgi:hypothetical protein
VTPVTQRVPIEYWVCACVKRTRRGVLTHLKCHAPTVDRCRVCGITKAQTERVDAVLQREGKL